MTRAPSSRWELQTQQERMDDVEAQGGRNLLFLLGRQFWSGIHDLPYALYRELITQITEIP